MTFARPDLLGLAPLVVLLVVVGITSHWRRARRLVEAYGGPDPTRRLTGRSLDKFPAARLTCLVVAVVALTVAAAEPRPEESEPVDSGTPIDLIVAVDISHSMTAADVDPTRIGLARSVVNELIQGGVADRVALSLFADWPFGLVPLTDDPGVISFFTPWVESELIGARDQGTSLAAVVGHAVDAWETRSRPGTLPLLLIVTDGEAHGTRDAIMDSIAAASAAGIVVWTAGVGSEAGAPLFAPGTTDVPLLDGAGQAVTSTYDADLLREMARTGGGAFHEISSEGGVRRLVDDLRDLGGNVESDTAPQPFPLAIVLVLALALLAAESVLDSGRPMRKGRA